MPTLHTCKLYGSVTHNFNGTGMEPNTRLKIKHYNGTGDVCLGVLNEKIEKALRTQPDDHRVNLLLYVTE